MKSLHPDELEELYTSVLSKYPRMLSSLASNLGYYKHGEYADLCKGPWNSDGEKWQTIWDTAFTFLWLILVAEGYEK